MQGAIPELLETALTKYAADYDRWAYTETLIERNEKEKLLKETVVRFDPSKPYAEQYTPLKINGEPPSAADLKKYRRKGERREKQREQAEKKGETPTRTLGELMDLENTRLIEDRDDIAAYEVPLRKEGNNRLPPDKFKVVVRVTKSSATFESIAVELRSAMRAKAVVKIKSGAFLLKFASVSPEFAPAVVSASARGAGSVLFVTIGRSYDLVRGEFHRVKPYAERFEVKMGPLKSLDF